MQLNKTVLQLKYIQSKKILLDYDFLREETLST